MKNLILELNPIVRDVKHYFNFLFTKGYRIRDAKVSFLSSYNWSIDLESSKCAIRIWCDQFAVFVVFAPLGTVINRQLDIRALIYYFTKRELFIGKFDDALMSRESQMKQLARLVEENLEKIESYFDADVFPEFSDEILRAVQEYIVRYMKKYIPGF